jgi:hypothetical protein
MTAAADSVRSRATTAASARGRDSAACPTETGYGNDGKDFDLCHGTLERPRDVFPDEHAQPGSNKPSTVAKVPLAMVGNPRPLRELSSPEFPIRHVKSSQNRNDSVLKTGFISRRGRQVGGAI